MSTNIPAQPPPPDYAAANKEGIFTDISTLPTRNAIQQAARLGTKVDYYDPVSGTTKTADFTGLGDISYAKAAADLAAQTNAEVQRQQLALRQELGAANAAQTAKEIKAADPLGYQIRQDIYSKVGNDLKSEKFDAAGYLKKNADIGGAFNSLNPGSKPGTRSVQTPDGVVDMTPEEFAEYHYNNFGKAEGREGTYVPTHEQVKPSANIAAAETRVAQLADNAPENDGRLGALYGEAGRTLDSTRTVAGLQREAAQLGARTGSKLGSIYDEATRLPTDFTDMNAAALSPALQQAVADYQLGGKLNDAELRNLTDDVRAGQAARGNYLGDAAAVQEALRQVAASDQKKQQRFENLMAVQNQAFGQSDALRNESQSAKLARLGQLTGLQGQEFGQGQSLIQTKSGLEQQRFGNEATRLGQMASLAGQDFNQNQQAYNTRLNAANAAMSAATTRGQDERSARTEQFGYDQQRLANASSAVLGTPITNQFGALGGAQQGAVAYTPVGVNGAIGLNANAGNQAAQFAQSSFGTLANMWNTTANIAQQDNAGKMSMISGMGGAALGAMI